MLAKQTANLTKLKATPGVLDMIIAEALVQDELHGRPRRALRRTGGGHRMSTDSMIAFSVAEALLLVIILAVALTRVRQGLSGISGGLTALAGALATVESQHLRPLGTVVGADQRALRRRS